MKTTEELLSNNTELQKEIEKLKNERDFYKLSGVAYKRDAKFLRLEKNKLERNLFLAIKALEKYANTVNWMGFENDGDGELWCNEFFVQYDSDYEKLSGTTIYCAGRAARETLKAIRGEK